MIGGFSVKMVVNKAEIKEMSDMVSIATSLGVDMQRHGSVWFIRCPNHHGVHKYDQHIGNCYISKDRKAFVCKSCGNHGDVLTLIQQVLGCSFWDAMRYLSDQTGVDLEFANEGESYVDKYGNKKIARRILSKEEQNLIGITNEAIYGCKEIIEDYFTAQEYAAVSVTDNKNTLLYWVNNEVIEGNPLVRIASDSYDCYCHIIRYFTRNAYHKLVDCFEKWSDTPYLPYVDKEINNDVSRLKSIYEDVGGNPKEIKFLRKSMEFSIDLTQVPF